MNVVALVDCNSFYASCETIFKPHLKNQPVVVLSNNDGCVIARSSLAKKVGIKMGVPFFEVKKTVKQKRKDLRKFENKSSLEEATKITKLNESKKTQKTIWEKKDKNKTYRQYYDASKHKGKSGGQD